MLILENSETVLQTVGRALDAVMEVNGPFRGLRAEPAAG